MSTSDSFHPTERFSSRVADYVRFRPRYPAALIDLMREVCGLDARHVVADVGSGTGFLAELFLANGNVVYGVEPNREMRLAGEAFLEGWPAFHSVDGTAEATTLADGSVDLIVAGQAFHWFDPARTRAEFARILRPGGWVGLIWNSRHIDTTPFLRAYEALLRRYGTDYEAVVHRTISSGDVATLTAFFAPNAFAKRVAGLNRQALDFEGIKGRLLSASYVPQAGEPGYEEMLADLRAAFDEHNEDGVICLDYDTELFYGRLHGNHLQ